MFENLCLAFKNAEYAFITFSDYCSKNKPNRFVILRHDVDMNPKNALISGILEDSMNIKASYYFRMTKRSFDASVVERLVRLGHEIGYHYEDLSMANGRMQYAIESFKRNLYALRQLYPVRTISMHGSPLSKWDNRLLWKNYDYRDFGIVGEPYLDVDFDEILYLTDTGRSWNSLDVSIRDKVQSGFNHSFRDTGDIIEELNNSHLPERLMLNIHPQRWHDRYLPWLRELIWQNTKNIGKRMLSARR